MSRKGGERKGWETYEVVAQHILEMVASRFGLSGIEGSQRVTGRRSGTSWQLDAKGVLEGTDIFMIVECRRKPSRLVEQGEIGELAYRISDTGAAGGIVVSPLGFQSGARKVAAAEHVYEARLDENSKATNFILQLLKQILCAQSEVYPVGKIQDRALIVVREDGKEVDRVEVGESAGPSNKAAPRGEPGWEAGGR